MDKWTEGKEVPREERTKVKSKRSSWWVVCHLWAGICLKIFSDVSGLSKLIIGVSSSQDYAAAKEHAGAAALLAVGAVVLGYFLSRTLFNIIDQSQLSKKGRTIVKSSLPFLYPLFAILLSALVLSVSSYSGKSFSSSMEGSKKPEKSQSINTFTTRQSAEGATESDFDQASLARIENWIVQTTIEKGRNSFSNQGFDPQKFAPNVESSSIFIETDGKKLGVIKIKMDESFRMVSVIGIEGAEMLRVTCMRASNQDIPVWSGKCGDEISKTFGVTVQQ